MIIALIVFFLASYSFSFYCSSFIFFFRHSTSIGDELRRKFIVKLNTVNLQTQCQIKIDDGGTAIATVLFTFPAAGMGVLKSAFIVVKT